jgi:hypothetical protein
MRGGKIFNTQGVHVAPSSVLPFSVLGAKNFTISGAPTFTSFPESWLDIWRPRSAVISTWTK